MNRVVLIKVNENAVLNVEFGTAFLTWKNLSENGQVSGKKKQCVVKYQ
jgi:hypothetical protein